MTTIKLNPELDYESQLMALLDDERFYTWLGQQPSNWRAQPGHANACPIYAYLYDMAGDDPEVYGSEFTFDGEEYHGPFWMTAFVSILDEVYKNHWGPVTKNEARAVLRRVKRFLAAAPEGEPDYARQRRLENYVESLPLAR
jgi:hypothetical protein